MVAYKNMTLLLTDAAEGDYAIEHFTVKPSFLPALNRTEPGEYVRLTCKGACLMSNTAMEERTNQPFLDHAHGDVLIAGLGLGMILLAVQDKPEVRSILVLEQSQEVINLVAPQLPLNEKITILKADATTYTTQQRFHTIYLDIWPYINRSIYEDSMNPLLKKYRSFLCAEQEDCNRWIDCWAHENARDKTPL